MREIKIWLFKDTGKFYTEEIVEVPEAFTTPDDIVDYIGQKYSSRKTKHIVIPMQEDFIKNGYPCMIPIS